jgi:hypothetical protein
MSVFSLALIMIIFSNINYEFMFTNFQGINNHDHISKATKLQEQQLLQSYGFSLATSLAFFSSCIDLNRSSTN